MKIFPALFFGAFLCLSITGFAQNVPNTYAITGITADSSTRKSMAYVKVSIKDEKGIIVKSTESKSDGSFFISNLLPGSYSILINYVGYEKKELPILLGGNIKEEQDIGTVFIKTSVNSLKEVLVIKSKPIIKQEIDKITYDLQADPESQANNVLGMIRKVPLLTLDAEDNILLKGDANYRILLNGRPSSMLDKKNYKDILRSMPASSIQRIEVITTPPSRYDAEGLTGIINIITNKKIGNGYNGNINVNGKIPVGGPGVGGAFTVKQNKVSMAGYGGASVNNYPISESYNSRITMGAAPTDLKQNGTRTSDNQTGYLGTELSYEIDSLNLISGQFNVNRNHMNGNSAQSSILSGSPGILQNYELTNANNGDRRGLDASLNYQKGFKSNKNQILTFSYRYFTLNNTDFNLMDVYNHMTSLHQQYDQINNGKSSEQSFQIDYVHPVKRITIEAGLKAILRDNESDFRYDSLNNNGIFEIDSRRSNIFDNRQNVLAFYNSYKLNLKNWGFITGFRLERTLLDGGAVFKQAYTNFTPSLSILYKLSSKSSLVFGYSQRIKRPDINLLNPFVDRSNPSFESGGNPYLRPMTANGCEVKYNSFQKAFFSAGISYNSFDKVIMRTTFFDSATNITKTSFGNTGRAGMVGIYSNLNYPITKAWNFSINGNARFAKAKGLVNNVWIRREGFMYNLSLSSGYGLKKGWRLNGSMYFNGPDLTLQSSTNSFLGSAFSLNKEVIKNKLSFSSSINNPFNKFRMNNSYTIGTDFTHENNNQNYFRAFSASLNYRFGKLKSKVKKSRKEIINDDVSSTAQ